MLFHNVQLPHQSCVLCTPNCLLSSLHPRRPFHLTLEQAHGLSPQAWELVWAAKEVEMEHAIILAKFMNWMYGWINVHGFTLGAGGRHIDS
jgi:hypothetical protein